MTFIIITCMRGDGRMRDLTLSSRQAGWGYPQKHVPNSSLIIRISVHFAQFVISLQRLSKTDNGRD
jgi:hypothetical protein